MQQHVLEATLPGGVAWSMPACVIVRMKDGLIVRLDEYLDSGRADVGCEHGGRTRRSPGRRAETQCGK